MYENYCIWIQISLEIVPKDQINNMPALVQLMPWCLIGEKLLFQPIMTHFTNAYHGPSLGLSEMPGTTVFSERDEIIRDP